ncbi:hypothetical protein DL771_007233 [Monosporascus sp. 5C6A]|nr:hypothetical protein DL771_007233 [Monosporascus sp. 5C6A]
MAPKKNKHEKKGDEGVAAGGPDVSRLDQSLEEIIGDADASRGRAESAASRGRAESAASSGRTESVAPRGRMDSAASSSRTGSVTVTGDTFQWRPMAASLNELAPVYQGRSFKGAVLRDDPGNTNFLATGGGNTFATVNNERADDHACQLAKENVKAHNRGAFPGAVNMAVFRTSQHARAQATRRLGDRFRLGLLPPPPPPSVPVGGGSPPPCNPAEDSGKKRKQGKEGDDKEDGGGSKKKKKTHAELDAELKQYFRENGVDIDNEEA